MAGQEKIDKVKCSLCGEYFGELGPAHVVCEDCRGLYADCVDVLRMRTEKIERLEAEIRELRNGGGTNGG